MNSVNIETLRREPAVLIGLLIAILSAVAQMAADGDLSWTAVVPLISGVVTRFFVSPTSGAADSDA